MNRNNQYGVEFIEPGSENHQPTGRGHGIDGFESHGESHVDDDFCRSMGETVINFGIPRNEWHTSNKRGRWQASYARTADVKHRAKVIATNWRNRNPDKYAMIRDASKVRVIIVVHPLTHGRFDPGNASPMAKAIIDALTECGFWPDDDSRHLEGPDYRAGAPSGIAGRYGIGLHITILDQQPEKRRP